MERIFTEDIPPELWHAPWCNEDTSQQQLTSALKELDNWRGGTKYDAFQAFLIMLGWCEDLKSLVDLGCGTGYYSALLKSAFPNATYVGMDVSGTAIRAAKAAFPDANFVVGDVESPPAGNFFFPGELSTVAMLSGILNHTPCPQSAIASAIGMTSKYLLLHRIPCYRDPLVPTRSSIKESYGVKMAERFFDEGFILSQLPGDIVERPIRWDREDGHYLSVLLRVK